VIAFGTNKTLDKIHKKGGKKRNIFLTDHPLTQVNKKIFNAIKCTFLINNKPKADHRMNSVFKCTIHCI